MEPDEHDALARRVQQGDRAAYDALIDDLHQEVTGFVAAHASSLELVDEVVQEAFVVVYHNIGNYRPGGTFAAWVKGFARNLLRKRLAERARHVSTDVGALEALLARQADADLAEERMDERQAEKLGRLAGCLAKLAPQARELATRRFVHGVGVNLLAQQFKRTRASIANALCRIRATLHRCVQGEGVSP